MSADQDQIAAADGRGAGGGGARRAAVFATAALIALAAAGCSSADRDPVSPEPPDGLESAPLAVMASGQELGLQTELWRDFMPASPPDGKPMIGILYVTVSDSTAFPAGWAADAVWILHEGDVWGGYVTGEPPAGDLTRPYRKVEMVRDGPKFGPGANVDVVTRLVGPEGETRLLRAADQWVGRTD